MVCDTCHGEGTVCSVCELSYDECNCCPLFPGSREEPVEYPEAETCYQCDGTGHIEEEEDEEDEQ